MGNKVYIKTYGCQMNVYDSLRMADCLKPFGFEASEVLDDANMVILNTCHIREKASEKVYSELGRIRQLKEEKAKQGTRMIVAVAGCTAQAEGEEIFRRAPFVDIVVGPQSYQHLPELVAKIGREGGVAINLDFPTDPKFDALPDESSVQGVSAYLSIQEGCDKFCTFCVVPYTRGAEYSRPVGEVYREAVRLAAQGAAEITLLGQNVNAYHGAGPDGSAWTLGQLIKHVAGIESVKRIRYMTSHPRDMEESLIEAHGSEAKLMPFLHLPIQSGSNRILKEMNRKHTAEMYLDVIARLRAARPDIAFSSDFIVGFPGETEEDFNDTLALVKEVGYAQAYSFKYSPRPGTPASLQTVQVAEEVKSERLARLQEAINVKQLAFNQQAIGKTMEVLLDRTGKQPGQLLGKTPYMQSVYIENANVFQHQFVSVQITGAFANSLSGTIV